MQRATLEVNDCVLRAPFDGEIAARSVDPGAFVRPGDAVATLVDRSTVRVVAEVPEADFDVVRAGDAGARSTRWRPTGSCAATIARRSPAADPSTRTVHLEIDVPDPDRALPVGTTAELTLDVGAAARRHRGPADRRRPCAATRRRSSSSTARRRAQERVRACSASAAAACSSSRRWPPARRS